jgi:hypothetical protein
MPDRVTTAEALATLREALADLYHHTPERDMQKVRSDIWQHGLAALTRLEARIEELEIRDKMRDDGERALISEIEARDARIAELGRELEGAIEALREGQLVFDNRSHKEWAENVDELLDAALKEKDAT